MESSQASLPLEMALYFNGYYSAALFVVTLLMFIYKAVMLPYPPSALGLEVAFVFLYGIVEWVRLRQGALLRGAGGGGLAGGISKLPYARVWCAHPALDFLSHHTANTAHLARSFAGQPAGERGRAALLAAAQRPCCNLPRVLPAAADVRAAAGRDYTGHWARVRERGGAAAVPCVAFFLRARARSGPLLARAPFFSSLAR
jgi:hypothetical protein